MLIKNITDKTAPKPIGIGNVIIMPGNFADVPNEIAYVDEFDKAGKKTGNKVILPAIVLLESMNQITYQEDKKVEPVEEIVEEPVDEKPKRTRKKAVEAE